METRDLPNESLGIGDEPHFGDQTLPETERRPWPARHSRVAWSAAALCAFLGSVVVAPNSSGLLGGGLSVVMIAIAANDARHFVSSTG